MSQPILSVQDLKKYFVVGHTGVPGKRQPITVKAVDGVSFDVFSGETLGLVGESGSGKSTVAYTVVGMYKPTAGRIRFRDTEIGANDKRPKELRKAIQIVFQDPGSSLNPRQNIKQILEMPLRVHRKDRNRLEMVIYLLEIVGLPPEAMYKYPRMLSGGENRSLA